MTAKLVPIKGKGVKNIDADKMRGLDAQLDLIVKGADLLAKISRARYQAYLDHGFTKEEALELIK